MGSALARVIVAFTVAKPPAMDGLPTTVHCNMVKLLGTWRTDGKRPTPARSISACRRPSGYGELSSDRVQANPGAKIFYSPQLSTLRWARIAATGANPRAKLLAARFSASQIFLVTVPWQSSSEVLTARLEGPCSPFSM